MALLAQLVVFGQKHEATQALSHSDASENNNEQSEWKNLRGTENTFAAQNNDDGVIFLKMKTRQQASWNKECGFLVCCQLTIKEMLFITLP